MQWRKLWDLVSFRLNSETKGEKGNRIHMIVLLREHKAKAEQGKESSGLEHEQAVMERYINGMLINLQ